MEGGSVGKNQKNWRKFAVLAVLAAFVFTVSDVSAQSYDPDQTIPKPTHIQKRMNKLGRGLSNIIFGWTEIPLTFDQRLRSGKPLTYLLTTAPVLGTTKALMRTGVGVWEVMTFPRSSREVNFEAIIEPEYLF